MLHKISICLIVICLLIGCPLSWSEERAIRPIEEKSKQISKNALVIGNAKYIHTSHLRNPANDAEAVGTTLRQLGFNVTTLVNSDQRSMEEAVRKFGSDLRKENGMGLFYYAGHGMQIDGENYLLPVDIDPSTEMDIRYDAVPVGKILGQLDSAENDINVVILDACRNNPFTRSFRSSNRGLAQVVAPTGSFISYATAPGEVAADGEGDNGLFTSKLLKHMVIPGLKLEEVFKRVRVDVQSESNNQQVPWDVSSLTGDFFFTPGLDKPPEALSTSLSDLQNRADWAEWQKKMETDFQEILSFEAQLIDSKMKVESWQRFLSNWTEDNPYSKLDDELRSKSQTKVNYWRDNIDQHSNLNKTIELIEKDNLAAAGRLISRNLNDTDLLTAFFKDQSPSIQYKFAKIYRNGLGVEKNPGIAFEWYKLSAEKNFSKAQTMLGYLYQIGSGTTKNLSRAIYWYEQAANKGESMAMFNLGVLYQKGRGVNKDINQARNLFRKSEALGNRQAASALRKLGD